MGDDPTGRPGDLSFDKAEFPEGGAPQSAECAVCKQPLAGAYYLLGGQATCERCKTQYQYDQASISGSGRFLRAAAFGLAAAAAGSAIWYAVRATTGWELGLIAVVVGLMVGGAVRAGSHQRGGPLYQVLAVALTYFGICAQYVPEIVKELREPAPQAQTTGVGDKAPVEASTAPVAVLWVSGLLLALALPFLRGIQSILGILIIGFALWEAWKLNKRVPIEIEGPFRLGTDAR